MRFLTAGKGERIFTQHQLYIFQDCFFQRGVSVCFLLSLANSATSKCKRLLMRSLSLFRISFLRFLWPTHYLQLFPLSPPFPLCSHTEFDTAVRAATTMKFSLSFPLIPAPMIMKPLSTSLPFSPFPFPNPPLPLTYITSRRHCYYLYWSHHTVTHSVGGEQRSQRGRSRERLKTVSR